MNIPGSRAAASGWGSGKFSPGTARFEIVFAVGVSLVVLAVYLATIAPGITWRNLGADGGDLLTAAHTWGIPHPSGYPAYLVALRVFSFVVPMGDEAFRGNLFSAVLAAASVGLTFLAALRLLSLLPVAASLPRWAHYAPAAVSALAIGVSRELWSQATITEVYALNAFFVSALLLVMLSLYHAEAAGGRSRYLRPLLALLIGLGLGNHLTLAFVAAPFVVWSYLWHGGASAAVRRLSDLRVPVAFLAGLAIYVYAPLASAAKPVLNWGHPETAEGFWWMVSGALYQEYRFGVEATLVPGRITDSGDILLAQFGFVGLVLAVVGLTLVWEAVRGFVVAGLLSIVLVTAYAITYDTPDSFLYLIPVFIVVALWMGAGTAALLASAHEQLPRLGGVLERLSGARTTHIVLTILLLAAVPGFSAFANYGGMNLHGDRRASTFAELAFEEAGPGAVIATDGTAQIFSLWYQSYVEDRAAGVLVVSVNHLQFDWYWDDIRREAPDRVPPERPEGFRDRVLAIADYNLGIRPMYTAGIVAIYEDAYDLTASGPLYRIEP